MDFHILLAREIPVFFLPFKVRTARLLRLCAWQNVPADCKRRGPRIGKGTFSSYVQNYTTVTNEITIEPYSYYPYAESALGLKAQGIVGLYAHAIIIKNHHSIYSYSSKYKKRTARSRSINQPMKNIKLSLLLTSAIIFGGFSAVYSTPAASAKADGVKPVFETLIQSPGAQLNVDLPAALPVEESNTTGDQNSGSSRGNACTPSSAIIPGTDFSPKINDAIRTTAITQLLEKIAACKPLPYAQDGITNSNSEGGMPQAPAGYYKEYTLIVPGRHTGDGPVQVDIGGQIYMTGNMQSARGPERIIIGGGQNIYYTPDHYSHFINLKIVK